MDRLVDVDDARTGTVVVLMRPKNNLLGNSLALGFCLSFRCLNFSKLSEEKSELD